MFIINARQVNGLGISISDFVAELQGREIEFLSESEAIRWRSIKAENYRNSWFMGRIVAKLAWLLDPLRKEDAMEYPSVREMLDRVQNPSDWSRLEIISRNAEGKGIRPRLSVSGNPIQRDLSISHSDSLAMVLLASREGIRLGCDLVPLGSIGTSVIKRFFVDSEKEICSDSENEHIGDKIWAVKETAYKALAGDFPFGPLDWIVEQLDADFFSCFCTKLSAGQKIRVSTVRRFDHIIALGALEQNEKRRIME